MNGKLPSPARSRPFGDHHRPGQDDTGIRQREEELVYSFRELNLTRR